MLKLNKLLIILALFTFSSNKESQQEEIIYQRIAYIYQLKASVGEKAWHSFGVPKYIIPLIYYTGSTTYIANPNQKFILQYQPAIVFKKQGLIIYKLKSRLDNIPFHMEVQITEGSDTSSYNYQSPFINCSSPEETNAFNPGLKVTTRQWAAMVVHECFHGFQFLHPQYAQYANNKGFIQSFLGDSLQHLYTSNSWFKKEADSENQALLNAIDSKDKKQTDTLVHRFFKIREGRRLLTKQKFNLQIDLLEKSFETMEGTARYIEAAVLKKAPSFKSQQELTNNSKDPPYLYSTQVSDRYFYAMGYNMIRLLDKLHSAYQEKLFKDPSLTLEDILKDGKIITDGNY